jgi:hypothetical protein
VDHLGIFLRQGQKHIAGEPELKQIERVWKKTRVLRTHNQYFSELNELRKVFFCQFSLWSKNNEEFVRFRALN